MSADLGPVGVTAWWEALRADPLPWLMDEGGGLIWRVLVEVVDRPPESPAVVRARGGANASEPIASLLADLQPDGTWTGESSLWARFGGAGWRVAAAAQCGADPVDPRLHAACERLLELSAGEGGFGSGEIEETCACLTARVLQALAHLGWGPHLRFQEVLAWLEELPAHPVDGGWSCGEPSHAGTEGGCLETAVSVLGTWTSLRFEGRRTLRRRAAAALQRGLRRLEPGVAGPGLGHPNLGRTDLAEVLWGLAAAGVPLERSMVPGLTALQAAQDGQGRWMRSMPRPHGLPVGPETWGIPGRASRWITLKALTALKAYAVIAGLPRLFPTRPGASDDAPDQSEA